MTFTPDQLLALLLIAFVTGLVLLFITWGVVTHLRAHRKYRAYYMERRGKHEARR